MLHARCLSGIQFTIIYLWELHRFTGAGISAGSRVSPRDGWNLTWIKARSIAYQAREPRYVETCQASKMQQNAANLLVAAAPCRERRLTAWRLAVTWGSSNYHLIKQVRQFDRAVAT